METNITEVITLDVVSAERSIFSGEVSSVFAPGVLGELGILPGHTPLMTKLNAGEVRATLMDGEQTIFYISGGLLEVQPHHVTVLSDTAMRAEDIDEAAALEAKRQAEDALEKREAGFEYSQALIELARASAQLRALEKIRKMKR